MYEKQGPLSRLLQRKNELGFISMWILEILKSPFGFCKTSEEFNFHVEINLLQSMMKNH